VLGLRQNLAQFLLLVAVNALVGGTLGQERTVLPLLATEAFHLDLYTSALTYILAFGLSKAAMNYFAGTLSDTYGRKPVLVAGWLAALPVPAMLILAPSWGWIVAANVLLGISQGLTWSTAVIMKMDLGRLRRCRGWLQYRPGVHPDQFQGPLPLGGQPGRPGQQPQ
jgi:MFS family permease